MGAWCEFAEQNPAPEKYWGTFVASPARGVLHTAETFAFAPSPLSYYGDHNWPHFTSVFLKSGATKHYQHIPVDHAARALENRAGGVETNRRHAIQIEIAWHAADAASMPRAFLDGIRQLMRWVENNAGVQRSSIDLFHSYPPENGHSLGSEPWRMSSATWNAFGGWCGHQHTPEQVHGDPGKIDITYLLARPLEIDMPAPTHVTTAVHNPVGPGYWLLQAQGGVLSIDGAPFRGSIFNIPPEKRIMDPDEFFVSLLPIVKSASVTGYRLITNKGDGYDLPYTG